MSVRGPRVHNFVNAFCQVHAVYGWKNFGTGESEIIWNEDKGVMGGKRRR